MNSGARDSIARFLGEAEAAGGPFALLGIPPADVGESVVLSALEGQLERVSQHCEGDTPAADEVRLALHASAAQLLDVRVRRQLVVLWGGQVDASAPAPRAVVNLTNRPLEHDAILTLGMFGGWNRKSLRRLLALAHARGIDNHEVAATLSRLASRRGGQRRRPARRAASPRTAASQAEQQAEAEALAEQQDPMITILKMSMGVGALLVVLIVGAAAIVMTAMDSGESEPEPTPVVDVEEPSRPSIFNQPRVKQQEPVAAAPEEAADELRPQEIALRLQEAIESLDFDEGASRAEFLAAASALSQKWAKMADDDLIASNQRVVEYVYRTGARTTLSREVIDAIGAGSGALQQDVLEANDVLEAAWSIGMLTRLSRERDLSAMGEGLIRRHLGAALGHAGAGAGGTFEYGAGNALSVIGVRLAMSSNGDVSTRMSAWAAWLDAVDAVAADAEREELVLGAIEMMLTRGPEPSSDKATFDAVGLLASKLDWTENGQARAWLVRWFADRRISSDDLHAVTVALVTRTRTPGVTQLMTLSPAASDRARSDLREQYVVTFGLGESVRMDGLLADWAQAARDALARTPEATGDQLEHAVRLSRLNETASLLWRGHSADADALLEGLELPLAALRPSQAQGAAPGATPAAASNDNQRPDGRWALRYLQAERNIPVRMRLLDELIRAKTIGPVDAEVLATEAIRGTPQEVRERSRQVALAFMADADMINGVLEELPRARNDAQTDDFLQRIALAPLPPYRSPDWKASARRALVERLLELTAASGEYAWVDALALHLAASYENRASAQPIPDEIPLMRTPPDAGESAAALWYVWLSYADQTRPSRGVGASVDELSRRRAGRVSLSQGLIQRFAAEQVSVCELAAVVVGGERAGASSAIALILADLSDRRRRARHIFTQLEAGERAMLRLWLLRLTEEPA